MLTQYNMVLHIFVAKSTIIKHSYYYIPGFSLLSGQQEIIYVNIDKILPEQSIQLIICMAVSGRSFTPLDTSPANTSGLTLGHFSHFLCCGSIISATHIRMWIHVQACPFSRYSGRYSTPMGSRYRINLDTQVAKLSNPLIIDDELLQALPSKSTSST